MPLTSPPAADEPPKVRFVIDSSLERTGFELLVPRYSELSWREVSLDIRRGRRAHRLSGPLSAGRTARRRCQRSEWRRSTHRVILAHLHDVAERERSSGQANQVIRVSTQPDAQRQRSGVPARKWDRESSNPACSSGESANFRFVADTTSIPRAAKLTMPFGNIAIREGEVYRHVASSFSASEPEFWAILR